MQRCRLKLTSKDIASLRQRVGSDGKAQPHGVLIALLLPAVQQARLVEHPFPFGASSKDIKITFRIGKDGRVMSLDWGDGNGPIDPDKEARSLPLPNSSGSGVVSGTLSIFDRWGNL
jgi:hypothetical protein